MVGDWDDVGTGPTLLENSLRIYLTRDLSSVHAGWSPSDDDRCEYTPTY